MVQPSRRGDTLHPPCHVRLMSTTSGSSTCCRKILESINRASSLIWLCTGRCLVVSSDILNLATSTFLCVSRLLKIVVCWRFIFLLSLWTGAVGHGGDPIPGGGRFHKSLWVCFCLQWHRCFRFVYTLQKGQDGASLFDDLFASGTLHLACDYPAFLYIWGCFHSALLLIA